MTNIVTKNEYQTLRIEIRDLKEKFKTLEKIIKKAQRKKYEDEILAIAKEADELAKKEKLPVLESLRELR